MVKDNFVNLYPVSKTIRFRLMPVGKTQEHIIQNGILEEDEERAKNYQETKKLVDGYHRYFIDDVLTGKTFDWNDLAECLDEVPVNNEKLSQIKMAHIQKISNEFKNDKRFTHLDKKELFTTYLPTLYKGNPDALAKIGSFDKFTSYFSGFNEVRKNLYANNDISSSIGHRLVTENFTMFNANIHAYAEVKKVLKSEISDLQKHISNDFGKVDFDELFTPNGFNHVLTQNGIDLYNTILGGYVKENKTKVQGINELVNLYGQKNKVSKYELNKMRMSPLYNQILSEHNSSSFVYEPFTKDQDIVDALNIIKSNYQNIYREKAANILNSLATDDNVLISGKEIKLISQRLYGNYDVITNHLYEEYKNTANAGKKLTKKQEEAFQKKDYWKICDVREAINAISAERKMNVSLEGYCKNLSAGLELIGRGLNKMLVSYDPVKKLSEQDQTIDDIKSALDQIIELRREMDQFDHQNSETSAEYGEHVELNHFYDEVTEIYNKTRNYVTKKPFSQEKIKLNFKNSKLAEGWSVTKEQDYNALILRKNGKYYLGILNDHKHSVVPEPDSKDGYEKMVYQYISGVNKMLPKCIFTNNVKDHFNSEHKNDPYVLNDPKKMTKGLTITPYDYIVYSEGRMKKEYLKHGTQQEYKDALTEWIHLCINMFHVYKSWMGFELSAIKKPEEYESLDEFYHDLNNVCYKVFFVPVSRGQIDTMIEDDQLYLFQIYNKDFAKGAHGSKNLHTMYFEGLFSDYNLEHHIFQLNGGAELFWRKASLQNNVTHKTGDVLVNRVTSDGETIPANIYKELYDHFNYRKAVSSEAEKYLGKAVIKNARFDISKDRRYKQDEYFFHVPITINYQQSKVYYFNDEVNDYLRNNPDVKIIGVDRGERNLIYVSLIDQNGKILEQKSFNLIDEERFDGTKRSVDYFSKLELREKERNDARKSWKTIGTIKELKEGYLSSVVHQIAKMMVENHAILVMENLNVGFKRGRMKVERQVYQKFEMMLINKLNLLSFKNVPDDEDGSIYHAYQLTGKLNTYSEIGNQTGFIFYVNAAYTSKIDPVTGFADLFRHGDVKDDYVNFINSLDDIHYEAEHQMFSFTFDYKKMDHLIKVLPYRTKWTVYTNGKRIAYHRENGRSHYENIDLTESIKKLLEDNKIDYSDGKDIRKSIALLEVKAQKILKKQLMEYFLYTIQLRNSNPNTGEDYIISPVLNAEGEFYRSTPDNTSLPIDADANGAYNIARKGLMILDRIGHAKNDEMISLSVSNKDWFEFTEK